jgi:hypothetical protein
MVVVQMKKGMFYCYQLAMVVVEVHRYVGYFVLVRKRVYQRAAQPAFVLYHCLLFLDFVKASKLRLQLLL